jgi:RNA polymerase sigma-70 factor (ECF subfamily)
LCDPPQQFAGRSTLTTWLYGATTHLCLNRLRNGRTRRRLLEGAAPSAPPAAGADVSAELRRLLARLPDAEAQVAVYHYCDGLTYDEMARLLDCSRRHVGNLLFRLRARVERIAGVG